MTTRRPTPPTLTARTARTTPAGTPTTPAATLPRRATPSPRRAKTLRTLAAFLVAPWSLQAAQQGAPTPPDVAAILQADALHMAIFLVLAIVALVTADLTCRPLTSHDRRTIANRRRQQRTDRRIARKD